MKPEMLAPGMQERMVVVEDWYVFIMKELRYGHHLSPEDIEDVSQEIILTILTRPSVDPTKVNKSFIKRLVKGEVIDFYRENSREPSAIYHASTFEEQHEELFTEEYMVDSWGPALASISEFLTPERFRVVYLLAEGYTYPEVAEALGISTNRVKALQAQVARRAEQLREYMQAINAIV